MTDSLTDYLDAAREAALRAAAVLEDWRQRFEVREKGRLIASVPLVTAAAVPAPRAIAARSAAPWVAAAGGGLTIFLVGCSLPVMRRRAMRSAPGVS